MLSTLPPLPFLFRASEPSTILPIGLNCWGRKLTESEKCENIAAQFPILRETCPREVRRLQHGEEALARKEQAPIDGRTCVRPPVGRGEGGIGEDGASPYRQEHLCPTSGAGVYVVYC